jgi:formate-dependent nitrite reductase membrane component NrfD
MIVRNEIWGLPIAVEMTLLATASFASVWAYLFWRRGERRMALLGSVLAILLPAGALGILVSELLKPPTAGMLVLPLLNPKANLSSWMVWGATGIMLLILLAALFAAPLMRPLEKIAVWGRSRSAMRAIGMAMSAVGIFIAVYTGLVLAYERGIPFWHSASVPILALFMGMAAGSGVFGILGRGEVRNWLAAGSALTALTYAVHLHLSSIGPAAAAFSAAGAASDPTTWTGVFLALFAAVSAWLGKKPGVVVGGVLAIVAVFLIRLSLLSWGAWDFP